MAKANLTLPGGAKVTIEGSADEVAALLNRFSGSESATSRSSTHRGAAVKGRATRKGIPRGPTGYILQLRDEGFFKARRSLPDIQRKLEEQGHIYAQTSLSPALVRLVRVRELRRIKEKKNWAYVS